MSVKQVLEEVPEVTNQVVFLPMLPEDATPDQVVTVIKLAKQRYDLSSSELDQEIGYARKSKATNHVLWKPHLYARRLYIRKLRRGLENLMREHGHVHNVTLANGLKELPVTIRFTKRLTRCKGHREYCTWVSDKGYCNAECQQKYKARDKR